MSVIDPISDRKGPFAVLVCLLCVTLAGANAEAQNPEKFERPQPPKAPAAAAPHGDPLIRELMRKGLAKENEAGFCAKMPAMTGGDYDDYVKNKPAGATFQYNGHAYYAQKVTCGFYRIVSVSTVKGKRCVLHDQWHCDSGAPCEAHRFSDCDDGSGSYRTVKTIVLK